MSPTRLSEDMDEIQGLAVGIPVHAISAKEQTGVEVIEGYLGAGRTGALLGSSGVGKSTLVNALIGEDRLKTREVRAHDSRGRHTTRHRHLIVLPGPARPADRHAGHARAAVVDPARARAKPSTTSWSWPPAATSPIAAIAKSRAARSSRRLKRARWPPTARRLPEAAGRAASLERAQERARADRHQAEVQDRQPVDEEALQGS